MTKLQDLNPRYYDDLKKIEDDLNKIEVGMVSHLTEEQLKKINFGGQSYISGIEIITDYTKPIQGLKYTYKDLIELKNEYSLLLSAYQKLNIQIYDFKKSIFYKFYKWFN